MASPPRFLVLANPGTRRWEVFSEEWQSFWSRQAMQPRLDLIPWKDIIQNRGSLDTIPQFDEPSLVRLESPGRDFEVTKMLLQIGASTSGSTSDWANLTYQKGHLLSPRLIYYGFCTILQKLHECFQSRPRLIPLYHPPDIIELFDKNATLKRLREADIPCPDSIPPPDSVSDLYEAIQEKKWPLTYVKLATGSSASGIAVLRLAKSPTAITSVVRLDNGFYNTRKLRHTEGEDLQAILQFILGEGSTVQRGIPMAQIDGQNFDVRVVTVHGEIAFTIFRLSDNPMTNLHLGGRRGDPKACKAAIPKRAWLDAMDHCQEVAQLYPMASTLGIDLIFERGFMHHAILEVNAFGDFFPGLTNDNGMSIHQYEIEATAKKHNLLQKRE